MSVQVKHRRDTRAVLDAVTPAEGELAYDLNLKTARMGDGTTLGGHKLAKWGLRKTVTPTQIGANQNDYSPTDLAIAEVLEISSDAARDITGLAGGGTDRFLYLVNAGSFTITLKNQSASSSAANRFNLGADFKLRPQMAVSLIYLASSTRWVMVSDAFAWKFVNDAPEDFSLSGDISPTQLSANTNDWAPTGIDAATVIRASTDASRNLTGLTGGRDGRLIVLRNVGSNAIVLKDSDANSTAANRFDFGADITLAAKQHALLQYDATDSRWKMLGNTAGAGVADSAVTAAKLSASACGGVIINGYLSWEVAANALTIALKTLAGTDPSASDPVWVRVRDTALTSDTAGWLKITSALSLVISPGSSLGTTNNVPFRIWAVIFNDGGTARIGAINCVSSGNIFPLAAWQVATSFAEGGAGGADDPHKFYTGTAVAAKPYAIISWATWESGLAAVGTWGTARSRTHMPLANSPMPGQPTGAAKSFFGVNISASTTGTSWFDTNVTVAITPTSAANAIAVTLFGPLSVGTASIAGKLAIRRGGTVLAAPGGNYSAGGLFIDGQNLQAIDFPGSTAEQTYVGSIAAGTSTHTVTFPHPGPQSDLGGGIITQELMT